MAGLYILLIFWVMHFFFSELAVATLGASAFLVFRFPSAQSSRPRILIGGYCIGALCGLLCNGLVTLLQGSIPFPADIPACALAVFLSMLLMISLNFEHPPSAALAVAVTIDSSPVVMCVAGLGGILLLCVLKKALKTRLRDL